MTLAVARLYEAINSRRVAVAATMQVCRRASCRVKAKLANGSM
jgi:NADH:ubiquinone oxidoreductase subunit E